MACDPDAARAHTWTTQSTAYSRCVSSAWLLAPSSAFFSEVAPLVSQTPSGSSKGSFSSAAVLGEMWFIWKAGYANKHTINFCSSTFFPLQRFFLHRLTLWCKTHQQPQSWYVNLTCQTGGMLRASIATQFPWWEMTVFMWEWKTWCTSSQTICCGITHSLLSNDCFTWRNFPQALSFHSQTQGWKEQGMVTEGLALPAATRQAGVPTKHLLLKIGSRQHQHFLCGVSYPRDERYGAKPSCLLTRKIRQFSAVIVIKRSLPAVLLSHYFETDAQDYYFLSLFISKLYCLAGKTLGPWCVPILPASRFSQWY